MAQGLGKASAAEEQRLGSKTFFFFFWNLYFKSSWSFCIDTLNAFTSMRELVLAQHWENMSQG